jgi:rhamnulokinase
MVGRVGPGPPKLETVHQFANAPLRLPDGLHWNVLELFAQVLRGLERAAADTQLAGIGIDTWGVDYALLDPAGRMLGLPFHYRDPRTARMVARAHSLVPAEDLYAVTGIQTMQINTVFQLLADEQSSALVTSGAERIALMPDLFGFWLTGTLANEITSASTTGLLDARNGEWATGLIERLGLPVRPFAAAPVEPGTSLGSVSPMHEQAGGRAVGVPVHVVAGHDTASAFVAAPLRDAGAAVLSSGTWSLLGLELDSPVLTSQAYDYNLTNERGVDGTIRLLANVMGLWLVQECRRHWREQGRAYGYRDLEDLAAGANAEVAVFDPDDPRFLAPANMPAEIASACAELGQAPPQSPGEFIRAVLVSLACKYRLVLERLERVAGRPIEMVHVIGGGSRNELHCRLIANTLGRPVIAGPAEASALGNVLVQARASGELGSRREMRTITSRMDEIVEYQPVTAGQDANETFGRFLEITGLAVDRAQPIVA